MCLVGDEWEIAATLAPPKVSLKDERAGEWKKVSLTFSGQTTNKQRGRNTGARANIESLATSALSLAVTYNFFAEVILRVKKMTSAQDIQMPVTHNSFSLTPLVRTTRFRQGNHSWVRRLSIQQQRWVYTSWLLFKVGMLLTECNPRHVYWKRGQISKKKRPCNKILRETSLWFITSVISIVFSVLLDFSSEWRESIVGYFENPSTIN